MNPKVAPSAYLVSPGSIMDAFLTCIKQVNFYDRDVPYKFYNNTHAKAFTPPAEKKMVTSWSFRRQKKKMEEDRLILLRRLKKPLIISRSNVASVGSAFKSTRKVKVLSLPKTIKEKSMFRAKALRREICRGHYYIPTKGLRSKHRFFLHRFR